MNILSNIDELRGFLSFTEWIETELTREPEKCYRCNRPLSPLSWFDPDYYTLPCWDCIGKRKSDREVMTENIIRNIRDYYLGRILGDRYFQLFIVDPIYYANTLPHDYTEFKKVITQLGPPPRNDIWFIDWKPGYPKLVCRENLVGLKVVNLSNRYPRVDLGKSKITIEDYEIVMPVEVSPDTRHKTRYGIFSKGSDNRKSKRVKVSEKCYRLWNTDVEGVKSIFKVYKGGEEIAFRSLTYQDYVILKLAVMRDRSFIKFLFDLLSELIRSTGTYKDSVFLKNKVVIDPKKPGKLNLIWNPLSPDIDPDYINISIL